ncbi:uncharacterized protein LOC117123918 [Anneissia japonica]|uniref:uncharacterized protein LOC117123918 n=1 Tax=Anneissia japonica TaxID=1529436 RepID=UPI00142555FD|nr:uncharacterized protein LOC117123918 [Anneissia japonica]
MKCITPNPKLPFSDLNMLSYNGLPSRPQRTQTRNMTGIYLGHEESANNKSKKNTIPPLARGRGMTCRQKTPVERRRYSVSLQLPANDPDFVSHSLLCLYTTQHDPPILVPYTQPMILRHPNLRSKQQQRVESLRSRDEHRGFNPMPIKKAKPRTVTTWKTDDRAQSPSKCSRSPSEFCSLPKKTGRNYVAVANSGYTHLESLGSPHGWNRNESEGNLTSSLMEEIQPEETQSNMPGIQSLLPHLKAGVTTKTKGVNTPLTIRSFRNPQNPHPVIQYSDPQARPQTLPSSACRPAVPAPYYYSSKNLPRTAEESGSRVRLQRVQGSGKNRDKILAAPGVGSLTRSANRKRGTPVDPPSCIEGTPPPTNPNQAKIMDDPGDYYRELRVPSGTPATSATNLAKLGTNRSAVSFNSDAVVASDLPGNEVDRTIPGFDSSIQQSRSSPASDSSVDADILEAANLNNSNNINIGNLTLTEKKSPEQIVSEEGDDAPKYQSNSDQLSDQIVMDTERKKAEEGEEGDNDGSVRDSSGPNIIISVQDDEGHSKMLNIQEEDFTQGTIVTKKRPLLRFSQIAEAVREASKRKQMEFQTLLEEHAELVSQIEEMEQKNKTGA